MCGRSTSAVTSVILFETDGLQATIEMCEYRLHSGCSSDATNRITHSQRVTVVKHNALHFYSCAVRATGASFLFMCVCHPIVRLTNHHPGRRLAESPHEYLSLASLQILAVARLSENALTVTVAEFYIAIPFHFAPK